MRIFEIYQIDIHYYFAVSYYVLTLDRNILILFEATHKRKKGVCSDVTNEHEIICGLLQFSRKSLRIKKSPKISQINYLEFYENRRKKPEVYD